MRQKITNKVNRKAIRFRFLIAFLFVDQYSYIAEYFAVNLVMFVSGLSAVFISRRGNNPFKEAATSYLI